MSYLRNILQFMDSEGLLPRLQESTVCLYLEIRSLQEKEVRPNARSRVKFGNMLAVVFLPSPRRCS
jgi:hypothetical protein